jgi:hypothetical protein
LSFKRVQELSGRIVLNRVIENIIRLVYLYNRKYYPGYMKWFSYEFYKLPRLAVSLGGRMEECIKEQDINSIVKGLEDIYKVILKEHNSLGITTHVKFSPSTTGRGLVNLSLSSICRLLEESLSDELRKLSIRGSCDQWITNGDILVWSEHFMRLKDFLC